jgi:hypothetical protein
MLGLAKYTLHPIGAMQFFWAYKILSMIHSRYSPQGPGHASTSTLPDVPKNKPKTINKKKRE